MQKKDHISIPKGNTQRGVYQSVFTYLFKNNIAAKSILDVPAGEGEFLETYLQFFPDSKITGIDPFAIPKQTIATAIEKSTAHLSQAIQKKESYDLVTCLSGVMCFDGIDSLVEKFHICLKPNGILIISNDNVLTIRDRLSFLFFGNVKRFKLFFKPDEGNWNLILPQGLWKLCRSHHFCVEDVVYCSITADDLLWVVLLPVFLPFYYLSLLTQGKHLSFSEKRKLFPIKSLIARHYYLVCRKS